MKTLFLPFLLLFTLTSPVLAQSWALGGYDAVSFASGSVMQGRSGIVTMWKGKLWHFASEENRARFEANPRKFAPAFEGLCPVSLANGKKEQGDPRFFFVADGKLYLFRSGSELREMSEQPGRILDQASQKWVGLR